MHQRSGIYITKMADYLMACLPVYLSAGIFSLSLLLALLAGVCNRNWNKLMRSVCSLVHFVVSLSAWFLVLSFRRSGHGFLLRVCACLPVCLPVCWEWMTSVSGFLEWMTSACFCCLSAVDDFNTLVTVCLEQVTRMVLCFNILYLSVCLPTCLSCLSGME